MEVARKTLLELNQWSLPGTIEEEKPPKSKSKGNVLEEEQATFEVMERELTDMILNRTDGKTTDKKKYDYMD